MTYAPSELPHSLSNELMRLFYQAELTWRKERRLLECLGFHQAVSILELGSGPGFISAKLLEELSPGSLQRVEPNGEMSELARLFLDGKGLLQRSPEAPDLGALLARPGRFGGCYARYVLQHVEDLAQTVQSVFDLLQPGAAFAILEDDRDLDVHSNRPIGAHREFRRRMEQRVLDHGSQRAMLARLPALLADAGFEEVDVDVVAVLAGGSFDQNALEYFNPRHLEPFRASGVLDGSLLSRMAEEFRSFAEPGAFFLKSVVMVNGKKPTEAGV